MTQITSDLDQSLDLFFRTMDVLDIDDPNYTSQLLWRTQQFSNSSSCPSCIKSQSIPSSFPLYRRESLSLLYAYAAAQGGHIGAQLALGFRHVYGLGVPKRCTAGATYYLQVARQVAQVSAMGIPPVSEIVRLDVDSIAYEGHSGGAGVKMQTHLVDLQQHLADSGHPGIQTAIAKKFLLGVGGCQQDVHLAVNYFKKAAVRGHKEAISWLGYLTTLGIGVEKNYDLAMKIFSFVISLQNDPMGKSINK